MRPSCATALGPLQAFQLPQSPACAPHCFPASSHPLAPLRSSILFRGCQKGFAKPGSNPVLPPPEALRVAPGPQSNVPLPCLTQESPGDQPQPPACLFLPCWLSPPPYAPGRALGPTHPHPGRLTLGHGACSLRTGAQPPASKGLGSSLCSPSCPLQQRCQAPVKPLLCAGRWEGSIKEDTPPQGLRLDTFPTDL